MSQGTCGHRIAPTSDKTTTSVKKIFILCDTVSDILGDGRLRPEDFYTGPSWALNAKNEFQRVCRLLYDPGVVAWLEEFEPTRLKDLRKRHKYLFARMNRRINIKFNRYRDAP